MSTACSPSSNRDPGRILRAKIEIADIVGSFNPDLIHLHPCGPELVYFHQIRKKWPIPTVVTVHNNYSSIDADFGDTGSSGRIFQPARRIATVSDDIRRWLLSLRPELTAKTSTIHNGLPVIEAEPVPLPWDPPRLLYVGRIEAQKRLDVLMRASRPWRLRMQTYVFRSRAPALNSAPSGTLPGRLGWTSGSTSSERSTGGRCRAFSTERRCW